MVGRILAPNRHCRQAIVENSKIAKKALVEVADEATTPRFKELDEPRLKGYPYAQYSTVLGGRLVEAILAHLSDYIFGGLWRVSGAARVYEPYPGDVHALPRLR